MLNQWLCFLIGFDCALGWEGQDQSRRESENRANWLNRNHRILDWLLCERSSIICLQVSMPFLEFLHLPISVDLYCLGGKNRDIKTFLLIFH